MQTDVTVTQADRDAAANGVLRRLAYQCGGMQSWMEPAVASMRRGEQDDHPDIQDFARHRLAALADAQGEPVAWMYRRAGDPLPPSVQTTRHAAGDFYLMQRSGWTETPLYTHPPAQDVAALVAKIGELAVLELDIDDDDPRLLHFGNRLRTALKQHIKRTPHE